MRRILLVLAALVSCKTPTAGSGLASDESLPQGDGNLHLVGYVPERYLGNEHASGYELARVQVQGNTITAVERIDQRAIAADDIVLKHSGSRDFDVIYPGMINLHNHTKQNMMPVWGDAKGQFANRFEWRDWDDYTKAVSFNINPWIDHPAMTCAAFRWSELQAMVLGTTHLQGPSSCIDGFTIHQVEDAAAYPATDAARLLKVSAPTDIVVPEDMPFVWKQLKPLIDGQKMSYADALLTRLKEFCPRLVAEQNIQDVLGDHEVDVLQVKENVEKGCDKTPDKLVRYVYWQHKTIAGKIKYLRDPRHSALIVHLAEGRRKDPYNRVEFELLRLLGLDLPGVNLVHAVGVAPENLKTMAEHHMGIVWSPFSNLLLYGETLDVKAALEADVIIALGSDWTPTGSRGVQDELHIARAYLQKSGLDDVVTDERLYEMATENPAKLLSHFETQAGDGRHDLGRIVPDAAASFIVLKKKHDNAYTNFVTSTADDVDLVVIDGKPLYGDESLLKTAAPEAELDTLPGEFSALSATLVAATVTPFPDTGTPGEKTASLAAILQQPAIAAAQSGDSQCGSSKRMVRQHTTSEAIAAFRQATPLDLDRASDIGKALAVGLITQSWNRNPNTKKGDPKYVVKAMPSLYSCDDPAFKQRIAHFVLADKTADDEVRTNVGNRGNVRRSEGFGNNPKKLAESYEQAYTQEDY